MVDIAYYTELNLQICKFVRKRRNCCENSTYALDEKICDHFCSRRKAANFCHPDVKAFCRTPISLIQGRSWIKIVIYCSGIVKAPRIESKILGCLVYLLQQQYWRKGKVRSSVNHAKDWLEHSFSLQCVYISWWWSILVWSGLSWPNICWSGLG